MPYRPPHTGYEMSGWTSVCAVTGVTVCGIKAEALEVLNEDWEAACFVEKCADCFATVLGRGSG
jgi:hypothetical protein